MQISYATALTRESDENDDAEVEAREDVVEPGRLLDPDGQDEGEHQGEHEGGEVRVGAQVRHAQRQVVLEGVLHHLPQQGIQVPAVPAGHAGSS